jgi:Ca-activated chloride channel family protein
MSLTWPWLLLALPLPWLAWRWLPPAHAGAALRVPSLEDFVLATRSATSGEASGPLRMGSGSAILVWALLVAAAARPQWIDDPTLLPVSGRDLMIALDVSASMATADLRLDGRPVERLHAARSLATEFVARHDGDRVGLIVFGAQAYLHTPLTYDLQAVRAALADIGVGLAGRETALGDAIALTARRLREFRDSEKILIVLTDGANTAGTLTPAQAGWIAAREGLRIHALGLGAKPEGVAPDGGRELTSSQDLDEDSLRALAQQTGGSYHRATDGAALEAFYRLIDDLEPVAQGTASLRPVHELYPWPLGLALVFSVALALRRVRGRVA